MIENLKQKQRAPMPEKAAIPLKGLALKQALSAPHRAEPGGETACARGCAGRRATAAGRARSSACWVLLSSTHHLPEDGVVAVEVWSRRHEDGEMGGGGVRAHVGSRQEALLKGGVNWREGGREGGTITTPQFYAHVP